MGSSETLQVGNNLNPLHPCSRGKMGWVTMNVGQDTSMPGMDLLSSSIDLVQDICIGIYKFLIAFLNHVLLLHICNTTIMVQASLQESCFSMIMRSTDWTNSCFYLTENYLLKDGLSVLVYFVPMKESKITININTSLYYLIVLQHCRSLLFEYI